MAWNPLKALERWRRRPMRFRRGVSRPSWSRSARASALLLGGVAMARSLGAADDVRGLPFTRAFPWDEIGSVSRSAYLNFDSFGRLGVVQEGVYSVLNDTSWLDLVDRASKVTIGNVVHAPDGRIYFGGRGTWGVVSFGPDGLLRPTVLNKGDGPEWVPATAFNHLLATDDGVYFAGWDGIVHWERATRQNRFLPFSGLSTLFAVGDRVFASAHQRPIHEIDVRRGELRPVPGTEFGGMAVEFTAALGPDRTLIFVRDGRLLVFDGESVTPWPEQARHGLGEKVTALQTLVNGGIAVAVTGQGLFLFSADGELATALTTPQYQRITRLATNEPGVLWVATEDAVEKVLYGNPMTMFNQRLGLPVSWPIVQRWNNRLYVASSGVLYVAEPGGPGRSSRFEPAPHQPEGGVWAMASDGEHLLVGNNRGVYQANRDGSFVPLEPKRGVVQLAWVESDLCFVIGEREISALRRTPSGWREVAPPIANPHYPSVVHAGRGTAWIEYGGNRVGRVSHQEGELRLQVFDDLPWEGSRWVNIGLIDDTVVLSGAQGGRIFYNDRTEQFVDAPAIEQLLQRSPSWITRVLKDNRGHLWATHSHGLVAFAPRADGDYEMDASSYDLPNDQYPFVRLLQGEDVWVVAARTLHHLERREPAAPPAALRPTLVSVVDTRTRRELSRPDASAGPLRLPFEQNSLSLRFFAGSYAWRRSPGYEYRLHHDSEWVPFSAGLPLNLSGLEEGQYRLEVRMPKNRAPHAETFALAFEILPPWHRTWPAYLLLGVSLVGGVAALVRWANLRSRRRNLALERLVRERTRALEATMDRLNEETRVAATLAERNRLAAEIHDSLQQGLSGAILQLDATLRLPVVAGQVKSRLDVVRNMVSYTRHEVQHAVWDMESPLLEETELGEAIQKLTGLINTGEAKIGVHVAGEARSLPPSVKHHLLRIAQEATTNAVRHAQAGEITIALDYQPAMIDLRVSDNGIGFDPQAVLGKSGGHFGLRGIRDRVKKVQGELSLVSGAGQGTSIHVRVPLRIPPPPSTP